MKTNLLNLFRLTQDAAGTAKNATRVAIENMVGSKDPKFVKRVTQMDVEVIAGKISGLKSAPPQRVLDEKVTLAIQSQNSKVSHDNVQREYSELFDDLNGDLSTEGSMDQVMIKLSDQAALLTAEAGSPVLRRNFIESTGKFLSTVNAIAKGIGDQRQSVERSIIASVAELNSLTSQLLVLNDLITEAAYTEGDVAALQNDRDDVLKRIASITDIQAVPSGDNVFLYTTSGKPLVEHRLYPLSYTSSGVIDYSATYPESINPIRLTQDKGEAVDATLEFGSGSLGALLKLRDDKYPKYQSALDEFARKFEKEINKKHSQGVGFPPPSKLEGKTVIANGEEHQAINWKTDSVVRIAIVDSEGKFADPGGGTFYFDLNLNPSGISGLSAVDIRNQINGNFGMDIVTFSNAPEDHGTLTFTAPDGLRIAIGQVDGEPDPETDDGVGFSQHFQLNNLIEVSHDSAGRGYSNSIKVASTIASDPSLLALGRLNSSADIALVGTVAQTTAIAAGDSSNLVALRSTLNDPVVSFESAGIMPTQTSSFSSWLSGYVNTMHLDAVNASDQQEFSKAVVEGLEQRRSMLSGVNEDEESGEVLMNKIFYRSIIDTSKQLIEMLHSLLGLLEQNF